LFVDLPGGIDKRHRAPYVDWLDRTLRRNGNDFPHPSSTEDHVTAAAARSAPLNAIGVRDRLQFLDAPTQLALAHFLERFIGSGHIYMVPYAVSIAQDRRPSLRDPGDELILELAVHCGAMIVTHNQKDFAGADQFGVLVRTPAEFLKILRESL
jgi:hypothetical protein